MSILRKRMVLFAVPFSVPHPLPCPTHLVWSVPRAVFLLNVGIACHRVVLGGTAALPALAPGPSLRVPFPYISWTTSGITGQVRRREE